MTYRGETPTPLLYARIAGWLYLVNIACGMFGELFVRGHLVVAGDAGMTAHNILGSEMLFRYGIVGDLVMHVTDLPMDVIFYVLLRPVNKDLSLLAMVFGLMQTAVLVAKQTEPGDGAVVAGRGEGVFGRAGVGVGGGVAGAA